MSGNPQDLQLISTHNLTKTVLLPGADANAKVTVTESTRKMRAPDGTTTTIVTTVTATPTGTGTGAPPSTWSGGTFSGSGPAPSNTASPVDDTFGVAPLDFNPLVPGGNLVAGAPGDASGGSAATARDSVAASAQAEGGGTVVKSSGPNLAIILPVVGCLGLVAICGLAVFIHRRRQAAAPERDSMGIGAFRSGQY